MCVGRALSQGEVLVPSAGGVCVCVCVCVSGNAASVVPSVCAALIGMGGLMGWLGKTGGGHIRQWRHQPV